jgi:hypothetical protein
LEEDEDHGRLVCSIYITRARVRKKSKKGFWHKAIRTMERHRQLCMQVKQSHCKTTKAMLFYRLVQENATDSTQIEEWSPGDENKARRAEVVRVGNFAYRIEWR